MSSDIRIATSFKNHRKRNRLKRILGPGATDYLLDLWITVAEQRPMGVLEDWDEFDIADAAGWTGNAQEFVNALLEVKWLDKLNGWYSIHRWKEHQSWVCGAPDRHETAMRASKARWDKRNGKSKKKDGVDNDTFK